MVMGLVVIVPAAAATHPMEGSATQTQGGTHLKTSYDFSSKCFLRIYVGIFHTLISYVDWEQGDWRSPGTV